MNTTWINYGMIATGLFLWSGSAVGIVALGAGLNRFFRGASAAFRHSIWLATSVCILATPFASFWLPGVLPSSPSAAHLESEMQTRKEIVATRQRVSTDEMISIEPKILEPANAHELELSPSQFANTPKDIPTTRKSTIPVVCVCVVVFWILGVIVCLVRLFQARIKLARAFDISNAAMDIPLASLVAKLATKEKLVVVPNERLNTWRMSWWSISITISKAEVGPLIWGLAPAKLLLPASLARMPEEAQAAVLRHEFAHVLRGDELIRRYLVALRAMFWFHPLVRYCCDQVQLYAEKACDDQVLGAGHRSSQYSALLLELGQRTKGIETGFATSGMAQSQIANRIHSILQTKVSRRPMTWHNVIATTTIMFVLTTAISVIRPANSKATAGGPTVQNPTIQQTNRKNGLTIGDNDWPQMGGSSNRNSVLDGAKVPIEWNLKTGMNIRWSMPLGSESYGGAVVANGKVFVGTNNRGAYIKRYPSSVDLSVLLCFDELDGKFLWQHSNSKLTIGKIHDWPNMGICSSPLVDGSRLWYVTNRAEVVCLDTDGFRDGENDGPFKQEKHTDENEADVVWVFDMAKQLGVVQRNMANCSVTCAGDMLFVNTSQGVDEDNGPAPSFLCLSRETGRVLWTDSSPSPNILEGQWSSPAYGVLGGVPQVIFGGGDGYLYGFMAEGDGGKSKLLWKFDCNPKDSIYRLSGATRNHIVATPVIYNELVYIAVGHDPEHGEGHGNLWCIDPTKRGDVSPTLVHNAASHNVAIPHKRRLALDKSTGDFELPNPNSAAVWHYVGNDSSHFAATMHRSISTVAIQKDLLFVPDLCGLFHCLDAKTGKPHWTYDLLAACWSSPLIVDGRVYICDEDGDLSVFELSNKKVLLKEINHMSAIYSTPIVANDTLFVATRNRLWAIQEGAQSSGIGSR